MARSSSPPAPRALATSGRHQARSITAAAERIDLTRKADRAGIAKTAAWQRDAWSYFDLVPEVKFAARFLGSALGRLLLYPGLRIEQDENPASLRDVYNLQEAMLRETRGPDDPPIEESLPAPGLTIEMVEAAEEEMARLRNRRHGQAGLMRSFGVCLTIPGDSYLVGVDVLDDRGQPTGEEEWQVLSDQNIERRGDRVMVRLAPGAKQEPLAEDATVIRVWRPHEAWPALADSNMRAVLDVCEELLIYGRQFRSVGKSRNNAGVILLPNELDFGSTTMVDADGNVVEDDDLTPLERSFIASMVTPVEDDGSAAAVVPHMLRGPAEVLKEVRHISLDRTIDKEAIARVEHLISRLAHGLDVPVEILSGMADVNHWTAWQIQDSTYQAHVEPLAMLPAWALTSAYLRPMLAEHPAWNNEAGRRILNMVEVGIDPAMLVVRPNRAQDAKDAHRSMAISHAALRKYLGFSDADAPSDEELMRRYAVERGVGGVSLTREVMRGTINDADEIVTEPEEVNDPGDDEGTGPDQAPAPPGGDAPIPAETRPESSARALSLVAALDTVTTAVGRRSTTLARHAMVAAAQGNIGQRLATIDQRLRDRLQVAASAALDEAIRVAGNRLRARAANDPTLRAAVVGIDPRDVGPTLAAAGHLSAEEEDEALDGALAALAVQWDQWVAQAQDDVEATLRAASPVEGDALDATIAEYRATTDEDRRAGWTILAGMLLTLGRQRLRGIVDEPGEGEVDTTVGVQAGPIREALARAGGSIEPARPPAQIAGRLQPGLAGGVATGPRSLGALLRLGLAAVGWEWTVGAPSRPFPPHQALAGVRFTSWDDPALTSAGWPGFGHYFPGDHKGCQCDAVPVIVETGARAGSDETGATA